MIGWVFSEGVSATGGAAKLFARPANAAGELTISERIATAAIPTIDLLGLTRNLVRARWKARCSSLELPRLPCRGMQRCRAIHYVDYTHFRVLARYTTDGTQPC